MEIGAGSSAEFTRPHFPTTLSTSGIEFTFLSSRRITSRFSCTPEWGMVVGISKNDPSSSEGINSFPIPGNVFSNECHALVSVTSFGINPNTLSKPCQATIPNRITKTGMVKNFHLLLSAHVNMRG